jgi:hypothetical protein
MKNLLIALAALPFVSVFGAESNTLDLFVDIENSLMWRTSASSEPEIEWDTPDGAVSATLYVRSMTGETSFDVTGLSKKRISLALPVSWETENVHNLVLEFNMGESNIVRRGQIGTVCSMTVEGNAASAQIREKTDKWNIVKQSRAVIPVPAGVESLSIDGNEMPLDTFGTAGWYGWKSIKPKADDAPYTLSLAFEDGGEIDIDITAIANGLAIIVK